MNIDARKANELVRGSGKLPHGPVRTTKIAVFARSPAAEAALEAGAFLAGQEDLVEQIVESKKVTFNRAIATPEMMPLMAKVARILGPLGMMPNPKHGTLTPDVVSAVKEWTGGKFFFKNGP